MSTTNTVFMATDQAEGSAATQLPIASGGAEGATTPAKDRELTEVEVTAVTGGAYKLRGKTGT